MRHFLILLFALCTTFCSAQTDSLTIHVETGKYWLRVGDSLVVHKEINQELTLQNWQKDMRILNMEGVIQSAFAALDAVKAQEAVTQNEKKLLQGDLDAQKKKTRRLQVLHVLRTVGEIAVVVIIIVLI